MLKFRKLNLDGLLDSNREIVCGKPYMIITGDRSIIGTFSEIPNKEMFEKYYNITSLDWLNTVQGYSFSRDLSKPVLIFNSDGESIPYRKIHHIYEILNGDCYPIPYTTIGELPYDCIYRTELSESRELIYHDTPKHPSLILSPTGTYIAKVLIFVPEKSIPRLNTLTLLGERMSIFWGFDVDPDLYDYLNYRYRWLYIYGDSHFDSYYKGMEIIGDINQHLNNIKEQNI